MSAPLWQPTEQQIAATGMTRFTRLASERTGQSFDTYDALHQWSVHDREGFWGLLAQFADIRFQQPARTVLDAPERFPGARWFPGARLNYAENLLRADASRPALVAITETGDRRELSYGELATQTAAIAAYLKEQGVTPGDRVAGWLPNVAETVVAMLATTSLGAVWTSCSPDFGASGALDRFGQIQPRVLFACDGYTYGGKPIRTVDKVQEVAGQIESICSVVWVNRADDCPSGATTFDQLLSRTPEALEFAGRQFADPLYVMYSSGTTGKPKCIVHGVGGTLLQHAKEHQLHADLGPQDTLFFFTTCGWMMWNWLVSALATGCRIVLYEGSPFHPDPAVLWDMADAEQITHFGVSAKYLSGLEKAGRQPRLTHKLTHLRSLLSTGSPLSHEGFRYVHEQIKQDVHLASISGGTDLISCFVLGNPNLPVWEGEIQCAGLGMAVDVWNDAGEPVRGEKGELVCTAAFPSCPIGFWDDPDDQRFKSAYFNQFPDVWAHGDFAEITGHGGFVIHGRSDAVLNPGGVRIGTAEIYRQVEQLESIQEAICVGQEWEDDTRVVLFVVMAPGSTLTEALISEIRTNIRAHASPRHVPAKILEVSDIPRTMSGKIVELAVRDAIHGRPIRNTSALANPEALDQFANRPELVS